MSFDNCLDSLKISVVAPDLSGGGVTRVYILSQALRKLGCTVEVVGFRYGNAIYPPPPAGLPVYSIPGNSLPLLFKDTRNLLQHIKGDLVYAVKPRLTSFGVALLQKVISSRNVLLDIDDWELSWMGGDDNTYQPTVKQLARDIFHSNGALRSPEHRFYIEQMEKLVSKADAITVNNRFLQKRYGGTYLPSGKDTDLFNPSYYNPSVCRSKYGLSNYKVLMFPGTVRPHKGVEDVLRALDLLEKPELRLVIVGGRKPDDYEEYLMKKWNKWLIKLPQLPSEKMPEIIAAAHIIVVPQRDTPISQAQVPIKLTDGMAMAKPILSTSVGDIPTTIGDTGYLVAPGDSPAMAYQITEILANPEEAHRRGALARDRCIQHYSIEAMAQALKGVVFPLIASHTSCE